MRVLLWLLVGLDKIFLADGIVSSEGTDTFSLPCHLQQPKELGACNTSQTGIHDFNIEQNFRTSHSREARHSYEHELLRQSLRDEDSNVGMGSLKDSHN